MLGYHLDYMNGILLMQQYLKKNVREHKMEEFEKYFYDSEVSRNEFFPNSKENFFYNLDFDQISFQVSFNASTTEFTHQVSPCL